MILPKRYHTVFSDFTGFNISLNVSLKLGGRYVITFGNWHVAYRDPRHAYSHALDQSA